MSEAFTRSQLRLAWAALIVGFISIIVVAVFPQTEYHAMVLNGPYDTILEYSLATRKSLLFPMWGFSLACALVWFVREYRSGWASIYADA